MSRPLHNIVVGFDGSDLSSQALRWAADEARQTGSRLHVVVATLPRDASAWRMPDQSYQDQMREVAMRAEATLAPLDVHDTKVEQPLGEPVTVLCEAGETADMVVVGATGHGAVEARLLGSVSRHLAAYATCPVVVIRTSHNRSSRIVVGMEAGDSSTPALRFAMERAQRVSAPVVAIHGWKPGDWSGMDAAGMENVGTEIEEVNRMLAEVTAGLAEEYPGVRLTAEAVPVPPARALTDASDIASLLVVGSRGRNSFSRLLLGSVSQDVLHGAHCPVAIIR